MNRLRTSLLAGLLLAPFSPAPSHAALVAHWTADGTTADATGNGHNGSAPSVTYTPGVSGDAFLFDGTDPPIIVDASPALEPATISISLWVRTALENHLRVLIDSTHGAGQAGWALQLNTANNVSFAYGNGSGFPELVAAAGLEDGEFHHLAATLDGSLMRLYVDGAAPLTLPHSGTPAPSGRDIQIGGSPSLNRPFEGALDDIRIYDHVLTPQEIAALASIPEPSSLGLLLLVATAAARRRPR